MTEDYAGLNFQPFIFQFDISPLDIYKKAEGSRRANCAPEIILGNNIAVGPKMSSVHTFLINVTNHLALHHVLHKYRNFYLGRLLEIIYKKL